MTGESVSVPSASSDKDYLQSEMSSRVSRSVSPCRKVSIMECVGQMLPNDVFVLTGT